MNCKICGFTSKNNTSLSHHLRKSHTIALKDYLVNYENLIIPVCSCGKQVLYADGIKFQKTCGNVNCIKKLQRETRLEFMKNNPEQTAWRLKNISFPEKVFKDQLENYEINKKFLIVRERAVFPYYIDFAFENEKVAVEIDGSQHEKLIRKEKDKKKDIHLIKNGWRVFRIKANQLLQNPKDAINEVLNFIGESKTKGESGIILNKIFKEKQKLKEVGLTAKEKERALKQRKVERPSLQTLQNEIQENGYSATGRKYGVSDNAIRKWIKNFLKEL